MDYEPSVILGRDQVRMISKFFRKMFKIRTIKFPVLRVLDLLESKFSNNLYYIIDEDENFASNVMAVLETEDYEHFCIRIRQSVYDRALLGDGASLGYICHEMCHFILIYVFGIVPKTYKSSSGMILAKTVSNRPRKPYMSMEWQAKALCGEVMIPYEKCKKYSLRKIVKKTNSSYDQARYFLNHVVKENES